MKSQSIRKQSEHFFLHRYPPKTPYNAKKKKANVESKTPVEKATRKCWVSFEKRNLHQKKKVET